MVKIPKSLIQRLQGLGPHFIRVAKRSKTPIDKGWPSTPHQANDPALQEWLNQGGNYGVVGGYGLTIVDIDSEEVKQTVVEKLPATLVVESPGSLGWHLYFICSLERPIRLRDNDGENVGDIQGAGKMVVGPASIHPKGGVYRIIKDSPLAQVTRKQLVGAFKEYLIPDREVDRVEAAAKVEKREIKIDLDIMQIVPTADLHRRGNEYFGPHPTHGSKTSKNFWLNPSKNCWHCFRHESGGGPLQWLAVEEGIIDCSEAVPGALRGKTFKRVLQVARERDLIDKEEHTHKGVYFNEKDKFIPKWLAEDVMDRDHFITLMDSKEIYVWRNGYYMPDGEVVIAQHCKNLLQEAFSKHRVSEVEAYIRVDTYTRLKEPPLHLMNVENGFLDIDTRELKPHRPEYHFFNKLPVKYDPECKGEKVQLFLREVTGSESDAKVLEEFIGYCLYRTYIFHKALALVGEGANGKSTFLMLVKQLLGVRNVSGRGLIDMEVDRFAKASLFGKLANIYADLSDDILRKTGTFKMLTGGDVIEAQRKFQHAFTFVNYAKLLFSCNKLPAVYDNTNAFFRRWIIIVFPNVFQGDNCDPNLLKKLTTPSELSGFLNIALAGLTRLLNNGGFSYSKSTEETREDYIRKSDPLAAFVMDCIAEDQATIVLKQPLYGLFAFYCRENDLPAVNKDTFFKNMPKYVNITQVRMNRKNIPGRPYGFKGITLTTEGLQLWSRQSNQSKASSILVNAELSEDTLAGKNKVMGALDSLDPLDYIQDERNSDKLAFKWQQIPVAERCEKCGKRLVEHIIKTNTGEELRRCQTCFNEMRKTLLNITFRRMEC
jgi:putative DNA primase/helicase